MEKKEKSTLSFLKDLAKNNHREWFNAHKDRYLLAYENVIAFTDALLAEMNKHDHIETPSGKASLMRIYRDTRFSNDKTPYKTYFGGGFKRATKQLRGGYYFEIGPGHTLAAGGFFNPEPADLLRIRKDIDYNYKAWNNMLANKKLSGTFGSLQGESVATAPKGFARDHPAIELLRHKGFYFKRSFTDAEVLDKSFLKEMNQSFKNLRPYFDYMSVVLTTDGNGEAL